MAAIIQGDLTQIYRQPVGQMIVDKESVATARESYRGLYVQLVLQGPAIDSVHPDFPGLLVTKKTLQRDRSALGTLHVEYKGLDPAFGEGLPDPIYELDRSSAADPIDSHPDWVDIVDAAGGYDNVGKKVITDEDGVFRAFGINATGGFRGVQSYLNFGATWTKSSVQLNEPSSTGNLGSIQNPEGPNPTLGGSANWLYAGLRYLKEGGIYRVQKTWLASGPKGWNTVVY